MKVLFGLFVVTAVMAVLVVGTVVSMVIQLFPYLVLLAVALLVARVWNGRGATSPVWGARDAAPPVRRALPPPPTGGYRPPPPWVPPRASVPPRSAGRASAPAPGWAWMPVWIGPPPTQPRGQVIDAEVVGDDDG